MLKNIRKAPASKITWGSNIIETALDNKDLYTIHNYSANIVTELGEQETLSLTATSQDDAEILVRELVGNGVVGLNGHCCIRIEIKETKL